MGFVIAPLTPADWEQVRAIYLAGIATGHATFETEAPTWKAWDAGHLPYGRLAARTSDQVLGWAALSPVSWRECYAGVCEFSVYADRAARGSGAARAALQGLIDACTARGFWKLVSRIFPENGPSRGLCRKVGFREVGVYYRHGKLDGEWRDTVIVERLLGEAAELPV